MPENIVLIGNASAAKALIYKSPPIYERRRRILHHARALISELGYEKFSIRELARRAGVAQRTLYNAFGSRENIVINAIYQYQSDFSEHSYYANSAMTLLGRLERTIKVHSRNLQIRPYTTAIMAVYNSPASHVSIREAISRLSNEGTRPYADHLAAKRQLAPHVTPENYCAAITRLCYSTLSSWCVGEIADAAMIESMAETFLVVTEASTKGAVKREASQWLQHIRGRSPEWQRLRTQSVVPPAKRRAAPRLVRGG
jgi:AcrR family transcriptional regulator